MHAVELDGYWRVIDPQYLGQLLELVILTAQQEGYPLTAVRAGAVTRSLSMEGWVKLHLYLGNVPMYPCVGLVIGV